MLKGNCHCGQVKWSYSSEVESVTACNCSLCRRYGALWAYGFENIDIQVDGTTSHYQWANMLSQYHFCSHCGAMVYYIANKPDDKDRRKLAVNFRTVANADAIQNLRIDHFDGHDKFEDLPSDGKKVKDLWF